MSPRTPPANVKSPRREPTSPSSARRPIVLPSTGRSLKSGPFGVGVSQGSPHLFHGVRACCENCKAIFLAEFSVGGERHCSIDCRTMDKMYGRYTKPPTKSQPDMSASNDTDAQPPHCRLQHNDEKAASPSDPLPAPARDTSVSPSFRKPKREHSGLGKALLDAESEDAAKATP